MAIQLGALRDALLDAGASPEKAGKAAEELAGYEDEFSLLHDEMRDGFNQNQTEFRRVDMALTIMQGKQNLHNWMLASIFALLLAIALKIFLH